MKVLLVEDEPQLASFVKKGLNAEGYDLDIAFDGRMGLSMASNEHYHVIILDINLPIINGFELCRRIRSQDTGVPILMLTALDNLLDKQEGFDAGADDYLVKPFEFAELLMRIRALTRRGSRQPNHGKTLSIADLVLDLDAKVAHRAGQRIDLTTREYALLEYLMLNAGKIVSRVDITENVWGLHFDTTTNVIDVYISYLRKKIDKDHDLKLLHTVVGMGYVLRKS